MKNLGTTRANALRASALLIGLATAARGLPQASETVKLTSGAASTYLFGGAVSLSGSLALVGASGASTYVIGPSSAFLFERGSNGAWVKIATFAAPVPQIDDFFGYDVDLASDRALIGAKGAAHVYDRSSYGDWSHATVLAPSPSTVGLCRVALSGDRALIGSNYDSAAPCFDCGAAYVFERQASGSWVQVAKLLPSQPLDAKVFGAAVALEGDRAFVGAPYAHFGGVQSTGAVYVYERDASGAWPQTAVFGAAEEGAMYFGAAIAVDGDRTIVGSPWDDGVGGYDAGSAFVFERQPSGAWTELTKIKPLGPMEEDEFGWSVDLAGGRALVGAPFADAPSSKSGAAYAFSIEPSGAWTQLAKLVPKILGPNQVLGTAVSLDGTRALLGASGTGSTSVPQGSAYAFQLSPLRGEPASISLAAGGAQVLDLDAGDPLASKGYLLLGSASGTQPGFPIGPDLALPLVPDAYFAFTLANPNQPPLVGSLGGLSSHGLAQALFAVPAGLDPGLAGVVGYHAFAVLDFVTLSTSFASNAVSVTLVP